ncbi:N2-N2-dimethylguanosine tRNA methyltransferase [Apiospora arundinis]
MSFVRSLLRTQRLKKDDNLFASNPDFFKGHELDYLAMMVGRSQSESGGSEFQSTEDQLYPPWRITGGLIVTPSDISGDISGKLTVLEEIPIVSRDSPLLYGFSINRTGSLNNTSQSDPKGDITNTAENELLQWMLFKYCGTTDLQSNKKLNPAIQVMYIRARLARMTGPRMGWSEFSNSWSYDMVYVRTTAMSLAQAIDDTMEFIFATKSEPPVALGPWKANKSELDAVLGLWWWSWKRTSREERNAKPLMRRILSSYTSKKHADEERQALEEWRGKSDIKINKRHLEAAEYSRLGYGYANLKGEQFFGLCNTKTEKDASPDGLGVLYVCSRKSLVLNYAQEIYSIFLTAILQAVDNVDRNSEVTGRQGHQVFSNENIETIQEILISQKLCDKNDAFTCTIPIFKRQGKLETAGNN